MLDERTRGDSEDYQKAGKGLLKRAARNFPNLTCAFLELRSADQPQLCCTPISLDDEASNMSFADIVWHTDLE